MSQRYVFEVTQEISQTYEVQAYSRKEAFAIMQEAMDDLDSLPDNVSTDGCSREATGKPRITDFSTYQVLG